MNTNSSDKLTHQVHTGADPGEPELGGEPFKTRTRTSVASLAVKRFLFEVKVWIIGATGSAAPAQGATRGQPSSRSQALTFIDSLILL